MNRNYLIIMMKSLGNLSVIFAATVCQAGSHKIDSQGKFLPFSGVTVVAKAQEADKDLWKKVYESLSQNQLITQYYSLLPASSYHMTTINLFTKDEFNDWGNFVSNILPGFQTLHAGLQKAAFEPTVVPETPLVFGVIMIRFRMDSSQQSKIYSVAKEFSVEDKVPNEFHVTLAYAYKKIPNSDLKKIAEDMNQLLITAFKDHPSVKFNSPELCYFNDMTQFFSWDGKSNPFSTD